VREIFLCVSVVHHGLVLWHHARGLTCVLQACNKVGSEGATAIAAALKENSSVRELNLVR
jgi:predicted carbohydrate-binding protein with CBM5 and CBM33 domain